MLVSASNELPEEENLAAVYDRLRCATWWSTCRPTRPGCCSCATPPACSASARIKLAEWDGSRADVGGVDTCPSASCSELLRPIRNQALGATRSSSPTGRWIALSRVLRAAAWLVDCAEVGLDHLAVLRNAGSTGGKPDDNARVVSPC